jgi:hypothetical protein
MVHLPDNFDYMEKVRGIFYGKDKKEAARR